MRTTNWKNGEDTLPTTSKPGGVSLGLHYDKVVLGPQLPPKMRHQAQLTLVEASRTRDELREFLMMFDLFEVQA